MPVESSALQYIQVQHSWREMLQQRGVGCAVGSFGRNRAVLHLLSESGVWARGKK